MYRERFAAIDSNGTTVVANPWIPVDLYKPRARPEEKMRWGGGKLHWAVTYFIEPVPDGAAAFYVIIRQLKRVY